MRNFGIALLVWLATIAIAMLGGYFRYTDAKASLTWPTAPGVIEVAKVDKAGSHYWPRLVYSFQVNGVDHKGYNVHYLDLMLGPSLKGSSDAQWPRDHLAHLSAGDNVTVHYDPSNPSQSWLFLVPIGFWQCVPIWGFFPQFFAAFFVLQRAAMAKKWLALPSLIVIFILWVLFFMGMRPPD